MARLARLLDDLNRKRLPIHVTPIVSGMIETIAAHLPGRSGDLIARAAQTGRRRPRASEARAEAALARDAATQHCHATIVHGGDKVNVIPAQIDLELDGRLLPGFTPDDLIGELHGIVGDDIEVELVRHDPGLAEPTSLSSRCSPASCASSIPKASRCAAARRCHRRPVLRATRDPDLRLHADAAAGRLSGPEDRPRCRRAASPWLPSSSARKP